MLQIQGPGNVGLGQGRGLKRFSFEASKAVPSFTMQIEYGGQRIITREHLTNGCNVTMTRLIESELPKGQILRVEVTTQGIMICVLVI